METIEFKNGLRAVLVPCEAESVAVGVFVGCGSRDECAKTAGISHLIEHMLFKGTSTRKPVDISRAIEGRGGNFNACTGEEMTCYYAHLPSEYLADAVDILGDMYLNALIPQDEFVREKEVVVEEIKMYADEPEAVAAEKLQMNLFPGSQLGAPIAGSEKSLLPMTRGDLVRYIKSHYRADNTVVVVVGDFDRDQATKEIWKRFSRLRRAKSAIRRKKEAFLKPVPLSTVAKDVQQTQLAVGYRTFGMDDERKYAATVLDAVLGRGMSSRLFQEVREKRALSYDISSRIGFFSDAGMFSVSAGTDSSKSVKALATIDRELVRICQKAVPASELKRTKEFLSGNFRLSHERIISKLFYYGQIMLAYGRIIDPQEQVDKIRAVTAAQVQAVAREILRPEYRSVSWVVPR